MSRPVTQCQIRSGYRDQIRNFAYQASNFRTGSPDGVSDIEFLSEVRVFLDKAETVFGLFAHQRVDKFCRT